MIRPYQPTDNEEVLSLLRLNTPQYFAPEEEADLMDYLLQHAQNYYVFEENGQVIGCGGINFFDEEATARISWDMIHPDHQGKGIGKQLTLFRIQRISERSKSEQIIVRTSQLAFRFYEKIGFSLQKKEKDFWAEGFDLYQMCMPVDAVDH